MRRITDSSCIVESREFGGATYEVCATGLASFDETETALTVKLDSFVRRVNPQGADTVIRPAWLPRGETVRHAISQDEAADEAREAFHRWTDKVKRSVPSLAEFEASVGITRKQGKPA